MSLWQAIESAGKSLAIPAATPGTLPVTTRNELYRLREAVLERYRREGGERRRDGQQAPYKLTDAGAALEGVLRHLGRILGRKDMSPLERDNAFRRAAEAFAAAAQVLRKIDEAPAAEPIDWRAKIEDQLFNQRQALKLFRFVAARKHSVSFETLSQAEGLWRVSYPSDVAITKAIERLQKYLGKIDGCPVLVTIANRRVKIEGLKSPDK